MDQLIEVHGMVLGAMDLSEYDRRLVLLTQERGKITVFARGARKSNSRMAAIAQPFVMGTFMLYPGRDAYSLRGAEVKEYFRELAYDIYHAAYGAYFLEFAACYSRENMDGTQLLNLIYVSLHALLKNRQNPRVTRAAFEIRAMHGEGEFPDCRYCSCCRTPLNGDGNRYLHTRGGIYCPTCFEKEPGLLLGAEELEFLKASTCGRLTALENLDLSEDGMHTLKHMLDLHKKRCINYHFRSLDVLDALE